MSGMSDYLTAMSEIVAQFRNAWNANAAGVVGYVPEIRYVGVEGAKPDVTKYFARLTYQQVKSGQSAVGNGEVGGKSKYTSNGLIFVQLYGPMADAQVWARLKALAVISRKAYEGKKTASDVWFRDCRINELVPDSEWQRINVIIAYEYDEIAG